MLSAARDALVTLGIVRTDEPLPPFAARMSGNLSLLVYPPGDAFYLVKLGVMLSLGPEFEGLSRAYQAMPRNVPEPLALTGDASCEVMVTRGIAHRALAPATSAGDARLLVGGLDALWTLGRSETADRLDAGALAGLAATLEKAAARVEGFDGRRYWARVEPHVMALHASLQHGDLAVNNLGRAGDEIVIFDWEDFGRVCVPGFDLATLLLSLNRFDLEALMPKLAVDSLESALARRACERLAMTLETFIALLPLYLALFIDVKSGNAYGPEVSARACTALAAWTRRPRV